MRYFKQHTEEDCEVQHGTDANGFVQDRLASHGLRTQPGAGHTVPAALHAVSCMTYVVRQLKRAGWLLAIAIAPIAAEGWTVSTVSGQCRALEAGNGELLAGDAGRYATTAHPRTHVYRLGTE